MKGTLLAYDGSECGRVALRSALPIVTHQGGPIHLLAVVPVQSQLAMAESFYTAELFEAEENRIRAVLNEGVAFLDQHGLQAEGHLEVGEPVSRISALAEALDVALVVVGHRRRGPLARWWQASVGASLLDHLHCNLLVAMSAEDEANTD